MEHLRGAVRRRARPLRGRRVVLRGARRPGRPRRALAGARAAARGARLVEPALELARSGRRDAACARALPADARAGDDDARGRRDLRARRRAARGRRACCSSPGSSRALELVRDEGAAASTRARSRTRCSQLVAERGGAITAERPRGLRAALERAGRGRLRGAAGAHARRPLRRSRDARRVSTPPAGRRCAARRARASRQPPTGTRRTSRSSTQTGNACVLTTSLGLGSGDWLPGLDLHLNSMLGETDLVRGPLRPGERMASMMAPTLAFSPGDGRLELALGAAGGHPAAHGARRRAGCGAARGRGAADRDRPPALPSGGRDRERGARRGRGVPGRARAARSGGPALGRHGITTSAASVRSGGGALAPIHGEAARCVSR